MRNVFKRKKETTGKEQSPQKEEQEHLEKKHAEKEGARGWLYRRLVKQEEKPKTRAGQLLYAVKQRLPRYPSFVYSVPHTFVVLPKFSEMRSKSVIYPLIKPFAYANVKWDTEENALVYKVIEPKLTEKEETILQKLKEGLIQVINVSLDDIRHEEKTMEFLEEHIKFLLGEYSYSLGEEEYVKIMYYIFRDFIGLNEIEPLMRDPYIEDIGADGFGVPVYVVHQRYGSIKTRVVFNDEAKLRGFVTKLAERCDRYISYAKPLLDGSLPEGSRVQASLAGDVTTRGPTFSIRKFRETPFTPVDMIRLNTASPEMLAYLWFIIENGANMLITGGVATGKTTLLNSLSLFIPAELKIVSIEDTRELALPHENWIPGVARSGFSASGVGEVTMFELLKASFRQNPDYLIVGEIRGKEAYVMFQSMASIPKNEKVLVLNDGHLKRLEIGNVQPKAEFRVPALNSKTNKIEMLPFTKKKHQPRKELYKIETKTGRRVITTEEHSLLSVDSNGTVPVMSKDLKKGDNILIPARLPCGFNDLEHLDLLEMLPDCRVYAPFLIREAVRILGYDKACEIAGLAISDYYANYTAKKPSALKYGRFKALMTAAGIKYNPEEVNVKYDRKSFALPAKFKVSSELLRLIGYYISEGSLDMGRKSNRISLYAKQQAIIEDMRRCIKAVAGKEPKERETKGFGSSLELSFNHKVVFEILRQHAGYGKNRRIPDFIFGLSKEKIGEFLTGLYNGDGSFSKAFSYYTISEELASDLMQLLLVYGIVATCIRRNRSGRKTTDYELHFRRAEDKETFLKFVKPLKTVIIPEKRTAKKNVIGDTFLDSIKSIEKINSQPVDVYDLVVPNEQNFVGGFGGILLHNSGHPSLSTMHAGSVDDVMKRLQTKPISLSPGLLDSLDVVVVMVHAREKGKSSRRVKEVVEIESVDAETEKARSLKIFVWFPSDDGFEYRGNSWLLSRISTEKGIPMDKIIREITRRKRLLMWMVENNVTEMHDVVKYFTLCSREPEKIEGILGRR